MEKNVSMKVGTAEELLNKAKKSASYKAVDDWVQDKMILGIGSGTTILYVVERLAQLKRERNWNFTCIPTSFQAAQLIVEAGLVLGSLDQFTEIDVDIDGADEVDQNLNCLKGGGGAQTQEKIIAFNSKKVIFVADYRKDSQVLGSVHKAGIPIEVLPLAYKPILNYLTKLSPIAKPVLRMGGTIKAGPCITDHGNFLIDLQLGEIRDPEGIDQQLHRIPGVVGTGLFVGLTHNVYFGLADGTVKTISKNKEHEPQIHHHH